MYRIARLFLALALLLLPVVAQAQVLLHFHSFTGSMLIGRYPHAFVVLEGTRTADGVEVNENYGYSAAKTSLAVLSRPVPAMIYVEKPKQVKNTNRHFTVPISDATYFAIRAEVEKWRNEPYDLDKHNCVHFVGRIAEIAGLKVAYLKALMRKPKQFLNQVTRDNPQLGAKPL